MKAILFLIPLALFFFQCQNKKDNPEPSKQTAPVVSDEPFYGCKIESDKKSDDLELSKYHTDYSSVMGRTVFNIRLVGKDKLGINLLFDSEPTVALYNAKGIASFIDKDNIIYQCTGGQIEITKFDKKKNVISGKFYFDVFHRISNDTIKFSEGKFLNLKFKKTTPSL